MLVSLLWSAATAAIVIAAIPVALLFAPAIWAWYSTTAGGHDQHAGLGAFTLTLGYTFAVLHWVSSTPLLLLLLVAVPWAIGKLMMYQPKERPSDPAYEAEIERLTREHQARKNAKAQAKQARARRPRRRAGAPRTG